MSAVKPDQLSWEEPYFGFRPSIPSNVIVPDFVHLDAEKVGAGSTKLLRDMAS
jgi:hypothetical protein